MKPNPKINKNQIKNRELAELFGFIATIISITATIPQIYKTYTTRNVKSFSLIAISLGFLTTLLWGLNSYYLNSNAGLFSTVYFLLYKCYIIYAKLSY